MKGSKSIPFANEAEPPGTGVWARENPFGRIGPCYDATATNDIKYGIVHSKEG
jgi:hypothetical protein